jgi:UDP-N-acetylmuramate: L-alanyl-gamma-D-glutamyl-meso-diaminopimelate ligase
MSKDRCIYFMGIGGTGMAAVAGLVQEEGYRVVGSDKDLYPPMSTMLEDLKIKVYTPYNPKNLASETVEKVVIANALSRGHEELEYALDNNYKTTSFPALLGELFLKEAESIVVTGTHGKTTTTSLIAHVLTELSEDPSFLIGGIPKNFTHGFHRGKGRLFAIEGDEYDTAFFDKGPKFLHYFPNFLIINNIEFDHADIYDNLDAIKKRFEEVISIVDKPEYIIANASDANVMDCLRRTGVDKKAHLVSLDSESKDCHVRLEKMTIEGSGRNLLWRSVFKTRQFANIEIETTLTGYHNQANIAHVLGLLDVLAASDCIKTPKSEDVSRAFRSFQGVARRLDHLDTVDGIEIFEDFAHHPTAVGKVIEGFRKSAPETRLLVAFEPKNATSRRNIFAKDYARTFATADRTYIGACPDDNRIAKENKMDTKNLVKAIGPSAAAFDSNDALLQALVDEAKPGDAIIFMSSGSFSGVQYKISDLLREKFHG